MKNRAVKSQAKLSGHSSAFTLLEVLLAVGLSVVLLLAIASAIDLYRRMSTAAQDDLSEARLVRAVFKKFDDDIRSVVPPQAVASTGTSTTTSSGSSSSGSSGSSSGGSSSGSSASKSGSGSSSSSGSGSSSSGSSSSGSSASGSSSSGSSSSDPLQYIYSRSVFGLYGDAQSLVLNTLTPHRMPSSAQQPTAAQSATQYSSAPSNLAGFHGDEKVIGYFVLGSTGGGSPILSAGAGTGQLSPEGVPITSGLARLEGERAAIGYAMETSSTGSLAARIIAPEVQAISFRYFDGSAWTGSWSAATSQALPQAVEIVISVGGADPYGSRTKAAQEQPPRVYRHVVAITTAAAPVPIAEQNINSTTTNMSQ